LISKFKPLFIGLLNRTAKLRYRSIPGGMNTPPKEISNLHKTLAGTRVCLKIVGFLMGKYSFSPKMNKNIPFL